MKEVEKYFREGPFYNASSEETVDAYTHRLFFEGYTSVLPRPTAEDLSLARQVQVALKDEVEVKMRSQNQA